MGKPAARIGDMHTCPMATPATPPVPHVGGPILPPGCIKVLIGNRPAARVGDKAFCVASPPDVIALGAFSVLIGGKPAARMGDTTMHGGKIALGCMTVLIGDSGASGGGSGGVQSGGGGVSTSKCTKEGHPVDVATGKVFTTGTDMTFLQPFSLALTRTYCSNNLIRSGHFGPGWFCLLDLHVKVQQAEVIFQDAEGRDIRFALPEDGESVYDMGERLTLYRDGQNFRITN
ncbi:MAG: hypothetical protein GY869_06000, partial [Planctomycetes bacterium]|nr:hypothetical protein [Planctomycetota bacterium]